ncbi:MAG: hypothetical protein QXL78_01190 [Methanocellales archaeon]
MSLKILYAMLLVAIALSVSGCAGPSPPPATPILTPTPIGTATPRPGSVPAVDFNELIKFLPHAPSGYEAREPQGGKITTQEGSYSYASRDYVSRDYTKPSEASVFIMDSAYYTVGYFTAWKSFIAYETTEGYVKAENVAGYPAWKVYEKKDNEYSLYVALSDRFLVFIHAYDETVLNELKNSIDYKGIGALH